MQLQTLVNIPKGKFSLSYPSSILSVGSCFAANVNKTLVPLKFDILTNPFGTIYNPISLFNSLLPLNGEIDLITKIVERDDLFLHFDYHSDIRHISKDDLIKLIIAKHAEKDEFIKEADSIILTLGTAFYYKYKPSGSVVGNCHKIPAKSFDRLVFSIKQIQDAFEELYGYLSAVNPKIKIVITVSPVRHTRDGLSENNLSKSILRVFAHHVSLKYGNVDYFPAFEIMNDELRDYRFYHSDLVHPTELAVEYIMERFVATYFKPESIDSMSAIKSILKDLSHRPFNPAGLHHKRHLEAVLKKIQLLDGRFNFSKEKEDLINKINS